MLTVTSAIYASYDTNTFSNHVNPGLNPIYEANTISDTLCEVNLRHIIHQVHYEMYHMAYKALRKLLLDAVPEIYLDFIKHDTLGFGRCTSLDILDHLWDIYGVIDDDQLAVNLEMIKKPGSLPPPSRNSSPS